MGLYQKPIDKEKAVPQGNYNIGLGSEYEVERVYGKTPVTIHARYVGKPVCPHCSGEEVWIKHRFERRVRHESFGTRCTVLVLRARKFHCRGCKRYFNERFPGIGKWMRSTEGFRREIYQKHADGICQTTLAKRGRISAATVERKMVENPSHIRRSALCRIPAVLRGVVSATVIAVSPVVSHV